jgi:hypothetical protein
MISDRWHRYGVRPGAGAPSYGETLVLGVGKDSAIVLRYRPALYWSPEGRMDEGWEVSFGSYKLDQRLGSEEEAKHAGVKLALEVLKGNIRYLESV